MPLPRFTFTLLITLLLFTCGRAQKLDGLWEGTMLVGGIEGTQRLPMQLYLTMEGKKAKGRSYVQLPDGSTLRMDLEGQFFFDGSMELFEIKFAGDPKNDLLPEFNRQYQIVLSDDIWNPVLNGYWQEITPVTWKEGRRLGRMNLKRRKEDGA